MVGAVAVVVVALTGGCAGNGDSTGSDDRQAPGGIDDSMPVDPDTSATPSPRSGDDSVVDSEACGEVRAGIDAFNAGDYDETVTRFEAALPLAEQQNDGSVPASQLPIEAVRYYAELDGELYPEAARTSPEFATYKAITLGQCVAGDGETQELPGEEV